MKILFSLSSLFLSGVMVAAAADDREALKFFETEVRPLLADSCFSCHGDEKQKGGLRLDTASHFGLGGDSGPSVVPGKAEKSLLIEAVHWLDPDFEMPPKTKLPDEKIAILEKWVAQGAVWPQSGDEPVELVEVDEHGFTAEDREWWAVQPVEDPVVPEAGDRWSRNEIDHFIAAKLSDTQLEPAPEADPYELVRRAYFDLHGLPPTPDEIDEFVADQRPDAWERLIDRLLASPRYGERWGQHWLDIARYAESDGYRQDAFRPDAWVYRDYVIDSFNADKPYDQFVREQLAGDEIDPGDPDVFIGTAFLRNGIYEYNQRNARMHWELIINEMTNVTSEAFLGLGMGCAQCHDHKFDPILQKDYFALQSFLATTWWPDDRPLGTTEEVQRYEQQLQVWEDATKDLREELDAMLAQPKKNKVDYSVKQFPEDVQEIYNKASENRTPYEEQLAQLVEKQVEDSVSRVDPKKSFEKKPELLARYEELKTELAKFDHLKPKPLAKAFVATDVSSRPAKTFLTKRTGKEVVEPAFLTLLGVPEPEVQPTESTTGRRLALANWIASENNPLSTRVIVNRIWQHHFGAGIVPTPNDFGMLGELPSHPELLDWLTSRFLENGWRMKAMHKLVMSSATYRQTARKEPGKAESVVDPENRLLWRFSPRRLDAEQVRDAMLVTSGELKTDLGGQSVSGSSPRRSVYIKKFRNTPDTMMKGFDAPMGFDSAPTRAMTTTATQSLLLTNGDWMIQRARAFASRLGRSQSPIRDAFQIALGRPATDQEAQLGEAFLIKQAQVLSEKSEAEKPAWKYPDENGFRPLNQAFAGALPMKLGTNALWLQPESRFERLNLDLKEIGDEFTIEAVTNLDSLYPNAEVRTLASRWNGNKLTPGWTFGVTSEKSAYQPRNLIMQLVGEDFQGTLGYEVVASDLRVPVGKPVYIAASVTTHPSPENETGGSITFYLKDLSDPKAELQTSTVQHSVVAKLQDPSVRSLLGGRDETGRSVWDGQLARLTISNQALPREGILLGAKSDQAKRVVDLTFNGEDGEHPATAASWLRTAPQGGGKDNPRFLALADFCHALLNSNEFLYLH